MAPNNLKQADVIAGATVLPNANGSAPGLWISGKFDGRAKIIMLLPGPPHELKALFEEQCASAAAGEAAGSNLSSLES